MAYKRILTIQDISCLGQCSLTVALPILSAMGHETCVLPTAVLSTHTGGFGRPAVVQLGPNLGDFRRHWQSQGILFDGILVGYLGSLAAVEETRTILEEMLAPKGVVIVDPAMADNGRLYAGFDETYVEAMKGLCGQADILLPNLTEAALLAGEPYRESLEQGGWENLLPQGKTTVLTGVGERPGQTGVAISAQGQIRRYSHRKFPKSYHGTGDMFAAVFAGSLFRGEVTLDTLTQSAALGADFVCRAIAATENDPAHWYGVKFETVLPWLTEQLT